MEHYSVVIYPAGTCTIPTIKCGHLHQTIEAGDSCRDRLIKTDAKWMMAAVVNAATGEVVSAPMDNFYFTATDFKKARDIAFAAIDEVLIFGDLDSADTDEQLSQEEHNLARAELTNLAVSLKLAGYLEVLNRLADAETELMETTARAALMVGFPFTTPTGSIQ